MPNNCLSVLYKRIIQVENKNVPPPPPPPASYDSARCLFKNVFDSELLRTV